MKKSLPMLTTFLLLSALAGADGENYTAAFLAGTYDCQITAFAWPQRRDDPLMPNSQGTPEVVADGAGQLTEGSMSLHSIRNANEGIPCRYSLRNGSYTVSPDGSGRTDGQWKFMEGGGSGWKCFDRGLTPNGVQVGVVKPGPVFMEGMLATVRARELTTWSTTRLASRYPFAIADDGRWSRNETRRPDFRTARCRNDESTDLVTDYPE